MTLVNIVVFILIMIVLIVLHELGHMIVAKLSGMRVERFSVFMGKPLWSFTRGETQYGVGWLPIGGYVKITGMTRDELVRKEYDPETGAVVSETPEPPDVQARAYCNATTPRKLATIFAGPLANVIVAIVAFSISFWVGLPLPVEGQITNTVGGLVDGGPLKSAGVQVGDKIVSINGVGVVSGDPKPVLPQIERNVGKPIPVVIERKGERLPAISVTPVADQNDATVGRLRFGFEQRVETVQRGFGGGIAKAFDFTGFVTKEQVKALGKLVTDSKQREQVSSVVGIGATYNAFAQDGFGTIMRFVGLISLILAIMNLIPLMPLDGGHIVFALFERIRGKRLNVAVYQRASLIGIALVAVLFVYALNNDIGRLTGEGFRP
jgi:regulator of sigma E protease